MKKLLSNFITALSAEHIKKRGKGIYILSIIFGAIIPLILFIIRILSKSDKVTHELPYNYYLNFVERGLDQFASFLFPLIIIITVSRITQLDHKNGGWKLMETQPLHKLSIYFSKFSVILIANLLSIMSFVVLCILFVFILTISIDIPDAATTDFPVKELIQIITRLFVASLFITTFQYMLSVLISSFIWPMLIGFLGLLLTIFLLMASMIGSVNLEMDWNPYQILFNIATQRGGSDLGHWFIYTEYVGIICSVMVLYVGFQWYKFKKLRFAFWDKPIKLVKLLAVISISTVLLIYILIPNQMSFYKSTVLSGEIESDIVFKNVYVFDNTIGDTMAIIPINNGYFHHKFEKDVILDYYSISFDNKKQSTIFFGKGDSIYAKCRFFNKKAEVKKMGTRLAENKIRNTFPMRNIRIMMQLDGPNNILENADRFSKRLYKAWARENKKGIAFKTVDNYISKSDFIERKEKLHAITYLNYWEKFVKKRKALFPNEKTEETPEIKILKSKVSLTDESLLSDYKYFEYVSNQLIINDTLDIDVNKKLIEAISKLSESSFKDKMLYKQMIKSLNEASNTSERDTLILQYIDQYSNSHFKERIISEKQTIESLSKGKAAPSFEGITLDGKKVLLTDLKGKYVMMDVWATWCGPCIRQSPVFEKFAIKYKKENIQFVALSVDESKDKWFVEAKSKSKSVLQLYVKNSQQFAKNYNAFSIPRFILIDPNGDFINAQMPFPSEKSFEILLRKALDLPEEV